jgi:hypothetical protein
MGSNFYVCIYFERVNFGLMQSVWALDYFVYLGWMGGLELIFLFVII